MVLDLACELKKAVKVMLELQKVTLSIGYLDC